MKKRVVQDAFRDLLPQELYNRPKHGFEVPLLGWFQNELKFKIETEWLSDSFILEQNIFSVETIKSLKKRLFSSNPGDVHAQVWALIVFQNWYKKYMQCCPHALVRKLCTGNVFESHISVLFFRKLVIVGTVGSRANVSK